MDIDIEITYDTLPKAVTQISKRLINIERLLLEKGSTNTVPEDELLTVRQASIFLTLAVPTIYSLISKGELPVCKRGKRCYFSKADLLNYIKAGRKRTNSEIEAEAADYVNNKKGPRK